MLFGADFSEGSREAFGAACSLVVADDRQTAMETLKAILVLGYRIRPPPD